MVYDHHIIATISADRLRNRNSTVKLKLSSSWLNIWQQRDIVVDVDAIPLG